MDEDFRTLRRRLDDVREAAMRRDAPFHPAPAAMVATVFSQGHTPTTLPGVFAVHPARVSGDQTESADVTVTASAGVAYVTVIGSHAPAVGETLIARLLDGRWVAERFSGGCRVCVTASTGYGVLAGATITLRDPDGVVVGTCVTPADGKCCFNVPDGKMYQATITKSGYATKVVYVAACPKCGVTVPKTLTYISSRYDPPYSFGSWPGCYFEQNAVVTPPFPSPPAAASPDVTLTYGPRPSAIPASVVQLANHSTAVGPSYTLPDTGWFGPAMAGDPTLGMLGSPPWIDTTGAVGYEFFYVKACQYRIMTVVNFPNSSHPWRLCRDVGVNPTLISSEPFQVYNNVLGGSSNGESGTVLGTHAADDVFPDSSGNAGYHAGLP